MRRFLITAWLLPAIFCCFHASSQKFLPENSFADCGRSFIPPQNGLMHLKTMQVLPGGKILAGGNIFISGADSNYLLLVQFRSSGKIDTTGFGTNGILKVAF